MKLKNEIKCYWGRQAHNHIKNDKDLKLIMETSQKAKEFVENKKINKNESVYHGIMLYNLAKTGKPVESKPHILGKNKEFIEPDLLFNKKFIIELKCTKSRKLEEKRQCEKYLSSYNFNKVILINFNENTQHIEYEIYFNNPK